MEWGMIGHVYIEIIHALSFFIFGWIPKDIDCRIEEAARNAILAESNRHPAWDAGEWVNRGPVRPRLEVFEEVKNNRVLRGAVRRCAREAKDKGVKYWAKMLRHNTSPREEECDLRAGMASILHNLHKLTPSKKGTARLDFIPGLLG